MQTVLFLEISFLFDLLLSSEAIEAIVLISSGKTPYFQIFFMVIERGVDRISSELS